MELGAVFRQIFILDLRIADAGVEVQNAHFFQTIGQFFIQSPSQSAFPRIVVEINRQLARPIVCGAANERMGICVTLDFSISFDHEIRVFLHDIPHTVFEFFQRRHIPLERNHGVLYVIRINLQNPCSILYFCISDSNCTHNKLLL